MHEVAGTWFWARWCVFLVACRTMKDFCDSNPPFIFKAFDFWGSPFLVQCLSDSTVLSGSGFLGVVDFFKDAQRFPSVISTSSVLAVLC